MTSPRVWTWTWEKDERPRRPIFVTPWLKGPGLNMTVTTVPFMGTKTVTVKLAKGTYTYQCDPHAAAGMKGTFKVV